MVKSPRSTWFADSPTVRIEIANKDGLRLGIQGFLAATQDPNDDSLSVWLEWLDAPETVSAGTAFGVDFVVTAKVAEFWEFNWPATDTLWLRDLESALFVMADTDCQWKYRLRGADELGFITGAVQCASKPWPAYGAAWISSGDLQGWLFQFGRPPIVRLAGTRIQGGPMP